MPMPTTPLHDGARNVQFVPFIQGPRNCLGQYFALLEARIVLGLLIKVSICGPAASCLGHMLQTAVACWLPTLSAHAYLHASYVLLVWRLITYSLQRHPSQC